MQVSRAWDFAPRPPPKDKPKRDTGKGKAEEPKDEKKDEKDEKKNEKDDTPKEEGRNDEVTIIPEPDPPPAVEKE